MPKGPKTVYYIFIVTGLMLLATACKKHTSSDGDENIPLPPNVYVLGFVADSVVCWKNGEARNIYSLGRITYAFDNLSFLFVSGNDVYIAGNKVNNPAIHSTVPFYLKNDIVTTLPDSSGYSSCNSIFVSDNDVYVGGVTTYIVDTSHVPYTTPTASYPKVGNVATIWKNGVPITLPGSSTVGLTRGGVYAVRVYADYISDVYVSGNDVYASGGSTFLDFHAGYWKNGVLTDLTIGLVYKAANGNQCYPTTNSIAVSGNDVYVVGRQLTSTGSTIALCWKNGVPTYLSSDSIGGSVARSVFVAGQDVYIAGFENINGISRAMVWKNGAPTALTTGATASVANSIYVVGNDVYVAGYQWVLRGAVIATYWKNGEVVKLTDGTKDAIANAIFIQ